MKTQETGCIYYICNTVNGKGYVGQTVNLKRRVYQHFNGHSSSIALSNAIKMYGAESFTVKTLESDVPLDTLSELEIFHIKQLQTTSPKGYNLTHGGEYGKRVELKKRRTYNNQQKQKKFDDKQVGMLIRVDPDVKELICQRAIENRQSINAVVNDLLVKGIKIIESQRSTLDRTTR